MADIAALHAIVEKELKLFSEQTSSPNELYEPINYTLKNGGKRMRPLLVLLGCKIFSDDISQAISPAVGIEIFHNFTLLHDDIMDNAPLRRGKKTVHEKWDSNIAILSGDTMLIQAYQQLIKTQPEMLSKVLIDFNHTAIEVCEGQQMDMNFETQTNVSISDYLGMIRLKTAVLLASSLKIGAMIGGADDKQAQLIYDFGLNVGIAFQLQDDILDVYGETHKVGKQKGGDIISNKKTFLLLKAMELAKGEEAKALKEGMESKNEMQKVEVVTAIYNRLDIRQLAEETMWSYYNAGVANLEKIVGSKEWIDSLQGFTHNLMHREK